jgi:tubulin polyglutamylase TTLL5
MNVNLVWSNTHLNAHTMRLLKSWQRVNHFPRSFLITKKDQLYIQLNRAKIHYGNAFDFVSCQYLFALYTHFRYPNLIALR